MPDTSKTQISNKTSQPARRENEANARQPQGTGSQFMNDGGADDILISVGECIYEWDIAADQLVWSKGAASLLCLDDAGKISSSREFNKLLLPTTESNRDDAVFSSREQDEGTGVAYRIQYALSAEKLATSSDIWVEDSGRWFADDDGEPNRAHGVIRIINERRTMEERLDRLSRFDALTGLFNRAHLNVQLEELFDDIALTGENAAFLIVGLEHFDLINSVYGYEAGDAVILEVARRTVENMREHDIVGRFSGAKIGIILPECDEREMLVAGHRILNLLRENVVTTQRGPIAVTASIGGVLIPQNAPNSRKVFSGAHQALAESRRARNASIVSYRPDPQRDSERLNSARMAEQIVTALKQRRINLAWQPIVDATTKEVVFHEALIRLHTEQGSALDAGDFVSTAQHLGLIRLVDHHALDLALETLLYNPQARISLNVSNETACDPEWLSKLATAIYRKEDIGQRLIVEITESHAAESLTEARRFIDDVKNLGCKVALDDFGAGFTSFRNLKSLPFDIIKVDGQFVDDLSNCTENQTFIRALVDLARLFNAKTVVEWVEDSHTAELLRDWGVDYLQGYRFGAPVHDNPWSSPEAEIDAARASG